jgi:CheY-like chemotaxis protein
MSTNPVALALLGFTSFERRAFAAFFELGREEGPGYQLTEELWRADCAVADADDEEAVARVAHAGLLARAVLLGRRAHAGAALQLPRPINLLLVMRALDTLVGARPRGAARLATSADDEPRPAPPARRPPRPARVRSGAPAAPGDSDSDSEASYTSIAAPPWPQRDTHVQRVLDELAMRTVTLPPNIDARALAAQAAPPASRSGRDAVDTLSPSARRSRGRSLPLEHVLVIDQDAATLRLVAVQLQRFGFQMHLAGHPDDALRLLTRRFHDYVFMDPALPGFDALLACRLARQMPPPGEGLATTVVLLADPLAQPAPLTRALPAADACLKKPLDQQALLKLVGEREVARYAYADTARTTTLI